MRFYEGRKIEVRTKCKNEHCGEDIIWYKLFPQHMQSQLITNVISCDENVSSAAVYILEKSEDEIKVNVKYRCRFCDELHQLDGVIKIENGKLIFISNR